MKKIIAACLFTVLVFSLVAAQDAGTIPDDIDSLFGSDAEDSTVTDADTVDNPEALFLKSEGLVWGGDFTGSIEARLRYRELLPEGQEWKDYHDGVSFNLSSRLFFDARPDKNFRVLGRFETGYPFTALRVIELFSDFNWKEMAFFRFGKQTAAWGLSRFYQAADPISIEIKDPRNAGETLEGPVALKATVPVGLHTLFAFAVLKDSYLPEAPDSPGLDNLGYGIRGDFYIPVPRNPVFSSAEVTAGFYYQKDIAPRVVAGISTGIGDVSIFSDQVLSWGSDSYRLTSAEVIPGSGIYGTEKDESTLFYSATVGFMYTNSGWDMTLYGEYFFNGSGSTDRKYLDKLVTRYGAENIAGSSLPATVSAGDLFAYQSAHNSAISLSFSEIAGSDKWSWGLFWQQNWVDRSGLVVPSLTWRPWKYFAVSGGLQLAYGDDNTEFVLKLMDPESFEPRRLTGYIKLDLGNGKF